MESIGVRELRQDASRWLRRVAAGESFTITDRGRPVASLAPIAASDWDRLTDSGAVLRAGGELRHAAPVRSDADPTLTALLNDDRDDAR
ncbi:MAG: type II toxin-antitoxin system prevent-host-death family antitoxin [Actinomycetota bacterium]|jgi:prevent-host-death family protein|nr:type II toxin-antitoxin system prevent-host-death family antitoxin [Actinomycetota bacterium]